MPQAPKNKPEPIPEKSVGAGSRVIRWGGRLSNWAVKVALAVVFLAVCAGSFLQAFGLPDVAIRKLEKLAEVRGLWVKAERVYFDWRSGIVLEDVLLGPDADDDAPWRAGAYRLALDLNFSEWQSPARGLDGVRVEMGWFREAGVENRGLSGWRSVEGVLRLHPDGLRVDGLRARNGPHAVEIRSFVKLGENWQWSFDGVRERLEAAVRPADSGSDRAKSSFASAGSADWHFAGEPLWEVDGILDGVNVQASRIGLKVSFPAQVVYKKWQIDRGEVAGVWDGKRVLIKEVQAWQDGLPISLEGTVDPVHRTGSIRGQSAWRWRFWQSLLTEDQRADLAQRQVDLRGPLKLEWEAGDGPLDTLAERLKVRVQAADLSVLGIPLTGLDARIERDAEGAWVVDDLQIQGNHGGVTNRVEGAVRILPKGQGWGGRLAVEAAPVTLQPLFKPTTGMYHLLQRFEIRDTPLKLNVQVTVGPVGSKQWAATGTVAAENIWYRGVELEELHCRFDGKPDETRIDELYLQRPEGLAQGQFIVNGPAEKVQLDIASTVDFYALAQIVVGKVPGWLNTFTIRGQTMLQATGVVDYGEFLSNHLTGTLFMEDFSTRVIEGDQAYCYWNATSNRLTCADLRLHMDGGVLAGTVLVHDLNNPEETRWEMMGVVERVNLHQLVARSYPDKQEDPIQGILSGRVDLRGDFNDGFRSRLEGEGRVAIDEGQLFRVPLFGGLSGILSKIVPGFGYASQTAFSAKYSIGDGAVQFDPIELNGDILSVSGAIRLGFDQALSGTIRVKLLRKGLVAELIQGLTWPVSKLLEVRLTGTLQKPGWRPDNLPKELFLKFD